MRKTVAFFSAVLIAAENPLLAVQHLHPGTYPHAFQDQIRRPSQAQAHVAGSMAAAFRSFATTPKKVAVIMVQFPAGNGSLISGSRLIQSTNNIKSYMDKMAQYYDEASYHKLAISFRYFNSDDASVDGDPTPSSTGVYTMSHPEEYYGCGDEGEGCFGVTTPAIGVNANGDYLIRDALIAAHAGHASSPTHGSSGLSGVFDTVIVVHAGNGNETSGSAGDIWSIFYSQETIANGRPIAQAGGGWEEGDVVPETEHSPISSPLGVICHEFGHELGLPDLYNTSVQGGTSVVGNWELMDSGPFDGAGANPSHPGAWDKYTLGWATPQVIATQTSTSIGYSEVGTGNNMIKMPIANAPPEEYFLGEYRSPSSGALFDRSIPGEGLLIWHVDDAITQARAVTVTDESVENTVNSGSPHYGVSIVTADGSTISGLNQGSASNMYPNGRTVFSAPQSNNFAGQATSITVANIQGLGTAALSFAVVNFTAAATQAILKLINFPNPAGKGYPHPKGEGHTTIQFWLARPANEYQLNIYNLSGDLVRRVGKDQIRLNVETPNRSGDEKWVYEFEWDLTNGEGKHVAPGVYMYLLRADGKTDTGKAVIIR